MLEDRPLIVAGYALAARYLRAQDGECHAQRFLDANPQLKPKFFALVRHYSESGWLTNPHNGHMLAAPFERLLELKPRNARIFGFRDGRECFLTNGAFKANPKVQLRDYQRAQTLMEEYFAALRSDK